MYSPEILVYLRPLTSLPISPLWQGWGPSGDLGLRQHHPLMAAVASRCINAPKDFDSQRPGRLGICGKHHPIYNKYENKTHTHRYIYIYVCMYVYAFTNVYISVCLFVYLSINLSIYQSINQSTNQSIYTPAGHRSPVFSVPCARSLQECCKHFVVLRHAGNGHWPQLVAPIACLSFVYLWFNGRYGRMLYNATYRYTLITWSLDIHTQICSADPFFFRTFGQVHESLFTALLDPWLRSEQELGPQSLANTLQLSFGRTCPLC